MAFATPPMALLEIGRDQNGNIPGDLISAAYRASRSKPVMLVLDRITPREVDAVLDPMVSTSYREHRGAVLYAKAGDDSVVHAGATAATRVFAATATFRAKLKSWGIAYEDVSRAEPVLSTSCAESK